MAKYLKFYFANGRRPVHLSLLLEYISPTNDVKMPHGLLKRLMVRHPQVVTERSCTQASELPSTVSIISAVLAVRIAAVLTCTSGVMTGIVSRGRISSRCMSGFTTFAPPLIALIQKTSQQRDREAHHNKCHHRSQIRRG